MPGPFAALVQGSGVCCFDHPYSRQVPWPERSHARARQREHTYGVPIVRYKLNFQRLVAISLDDNANVTKFLAVGGKVNHQHDLLEH